MYQVLKHLPNIGVFNIVSFGTSHKFLFEKSLPCIPKNFATARKCIHMFLFYFCFVFVILFFILFDSLQAIASMEADMGGTELLWCDLTFSFFFFGVYFNF
jgi:hypothetical protein